MGVSDPNPWIVQRSIVFALESLLQNLLLGKPNYDRLSHLCSCSLYIFITDHFYRVFMCCYGVPSQLTVTSLRTETTLSLSASSTLSAGPGTHQALTLLLSWFSYTHFPILKRFYFHEADGAWSSCAKEWSDQPDHLDTTAHFGLCPSHGPG